MGSASSNDDFRRTPSNGSRGSGEPSADDATIVALAGGQTVFGRYELELIAGRGGMGVVWRARDRELERTVALKFLPEMVSSDPEAVKDLKSETRRCLQLTHPHIVRVHDFVQDGAMAAISMEFVAGASLARRKADAPRHCLTLPELTPLTIQLCDALDYAHQAAHVVHRDLKPANLLVSELGQLKVTDFGIARSLTETHTRLTSSTRGTSGTLLYMSPQQLMGDAPTPADDIYALGATLYELLAGKPPFHRGDGYSLMTQIREKMPPNLAAKRAELEIDGDAIPPEWESAILACLEKDPANRPSSARDVATRMGLSTGLATRPAWTIPPPPLGGGTGGGAGGPGSFSNSSGGSGRGVRTAITLPPPPTRTSAAPARRFPWKLATVIATIIAIVVARYYLSIHTTEMQVQADEQALQAEKKRLDIQKQRIEAQKEREKLEREEQQRRDDVAAQKVREDQKRHDDAIAAKEKQGREEQKRRDDLAEQEAKSKREEQKRRDEAVANAQKQTQADEQDELAVRKFLAESVRPDRSIPSAADANRPAENAGNGEGWFRRNWHKVKNAVPITGGSSAKTDANSAAASKPETAASEPEPEAKTPPRPGESSWTVPGADLRLLWVKPGTFTIGSPVGEAGREDNEGPMTRVTMTKGYWLGATPVTKRQWLALMTKDPSDYRDTGADTPVEQVSWIMAMAYCRRLTEREQAAGRLPAGYSYTLPTEAQWEYACRAGTTTPAYAAPLDAIAWYEVNRGDRKGSHPVGRKQPNAWGFSDMIGNVFQLCRGWDGPYAGGDTRDSAVSAGGERRVARGGSWATKAATCRAAYRLRLRSGSEESNVGFRVALSPD